MVNPSVARAEREIPRFSRARAGGIRRALVPRMNCKYLLLASLLLPLVPACAIDTTNEPPPKELPKPSTDFTNDKIYPSSSAQDDGKNLTVYAALLANGKFLTLGTTDRLVAKVGAGPDVVLQSQGQVYDPHYFATVPTTKEKLDVVLTLDREGTANDAKVELHVPEAFDLDGSLPKDVKQGGTFELGVVPAPVKDDGIYWAIFEGDCVNTGATALGTITPQGKLSFAIGANTLKKDGAASCQATVKVQHVLTGKADSAFSQPSPLDAIGLRERRFTATLAR